MDRVLIFPLFSLFGFTSFIRYCKRYSYNYTTDGLCAPEKSCQGTSGSFAYDELLKLQEAYLIVFFSLCLYFWAYVYVPLHVCVETRASAFVLWKFPIMSLFCFIYKHSWYLTYLMYIICVQRPLSNGKVSRRGGTSSNGSPSSTTSRRGSGKKRVSATMVWCIKLDIVNS